MMLDEMKPRAELASEKAVDGAAYLGEPQPEHFLRHRIGPPFRLEAFLAQRGVERVGDMIEIAGLEARMIEAVADRALRQLVRIVDIGQLAVLDAIEPLFLDGDHELAIDQQRSRGVVIDGVDSKDIQGPPLFALAHRRVEY